MARHTIPLRSGPVRFDRFGGTNVWRGEALLTAISLGSVLMGANTYIGNGPNFMVKAIAEHAGVRMPGFFHYVAYSAVTLLPLFYVVSRTLLD